MQISLGTLASGGLLGSLSGTRLRPHFLCVLFHTRLVEGALPVLYAGVAVLLPCTSHAANIIILCVQAGCKCVEVGRIELRDSRELLGKRIVAVDAARHGPADRAAGFLPIGRKGAASPNGEPPPDARLMEDVAAAQQLAAAVD